jgi:putative tryptophan/tyrosine transport system substrate-binding protein
MDRRAYLQLLAILPAMGPLCAVAVSQRVARIGVLNPGTRDVDAAAPFYEALRELGYVEGGNLIVERRYADNRPDKLFALAAELVALRVEVILAVGTLGPLAAKKVTSATPIVMTNAGDPVGSGLVKSLARPGGNVTGVSFNTTELAAKRIALVKELVPAASLVGILWNESNPYSGLMFRESAAAAPFVGLRVQAASATRPNEIDAALDSLLGAGMHALLAIEDPLTFAERRRIVAFALRHRLPFVSGLRHFAEDGALASYGAIVSEQLRRAATFVDRILKGAKPAELAVEQPSSYELVLNEQAARLLGLVIPPNVLVKADVRLR